MVFVSLIGSVGAFDAVTGEKIWETKLPHLAVPSSDGLRYPCISQLAIDDKGKLYCSDGEWIYVLDEFSGVVIAEFDCRPYFRGDWTTRPTRVGRAAAPTVVNARSMVYVATREGTLFALESKYGTLTLKWTFQDNRGPAGPSPLGYGTIAFAPVAVGDSASSTKWRLTGKIYIGSEDTHLYCLNATTGDYLWNFTAVDKLNYGATYVDDKLFFGIVDFASPYYETGPFTCINATTGELIWTQPWTPGTASTWLGPAAAYGKLYIGNAADHSIYALNQTNGEIVWNYTYPARSYAYGAPSVADGVVFQSTGGSTPGCHLWAINATTGEFIWNYKLAPTSTQPAPGNGYTANPAIADGRVYIQNDGGGSLYCFGKGPTETALSIVSSSMVNGSDALITGSVLDQSPASPDDPIANASVSLSYAPVGGSYTDIGTVTTASDGTFMHEWTLPTPGFYNIMAEWDGDDSHIGSTEEVMFEVETAPPPYPDVPTAGEVADEVIADLPPYPDVPTAGEVADEVTGELPAYTTIDIAIAAIAVITLLLVLYAIATGRKPS